MGTGKWNRKYGNWLREQKEWELGRGTERRGTGRGTERMETGYSIILHKKT